MIRFVKFNPITSMKTSFCITLSCLISLSIFALWKKVELNNHNTAISVNEKNDTYTFTATFNRAKTLKVYNYINKSIAPEKPCNSAYGYFDVKTILTDKTEFYIKESPGSLKIKLDKRKNSSGSYLRIKKMCEGLTEILTQNKTTIPNR